MTNHAFSTTMLPLSHYQSRRPFPQDKPRHLLRYRLSLFSTQIHSTMEHFRTDEANYRGCLFCTKICASYRDAESSLVILRILAHDHSSSMVLHKTYVYPF